MSMSVPGFATRSTSCGTHRKIAGRLQTFVNNYGTAPERRYFCEGRVQATEGDAAEAPTGVSREINKDKHHLLGLCPRGGPWCTL